MKKNHQFVEKLAALALAVTVVSVGISGCGSKTETQNKEQSTTTTAESTTTESNIDTETKTSTELKPFRVGCGDAKSNQLNDLAAVAQSKGYLEEELNKVGYTLKVTGFQGQGPEINAALMSGSLDAGNYAEFPALTSKASGADTTIAALSDPQLLYGILAGPEDIKTVKDLEGKKIVVQQGTALQYVWEQIVADAGIDADKVEVINSNVVDGLSLIQTGDADAVLSSANSVENFEKQGAGHVLEGIDNSKIYTVTLFNFSNKFVEEAPEAVVAVNKALIRAYEDVKENPQELYDILGEKYGEQGAETVKDTYTVDDSLEYLSPEFDDDFNTYLDNTYTWMNDNSLLAGEVDLNSYVDTSYYEKAVEELEK